MSERDWRKAQAAERVQEGMWTVQDGAQALNLSQRQMRRLVAKLEASGVVALAHGNRGRRASNRLHEAVRHEILALARGKYAGFNDTHFAEKLAESEHISVGRETLRRILREGGVGAARKRRPKRHFRRRERRSQEGMLLLWDGSQHDWLEGRAARMSLMAAVDDATGKLLKGAHFVPQESSAAYLRALHGIVKYHGVPWAIYMDRHSSLARNDDNWTVAEELRGKQNPTQVGRALEELDIEPIFAMTPQAKGRIERVWGTLQDRLVSELRLAGVADIDAANEFLEKFRVAYNRRFGRRASDQTSGWRPKPTRDEAKRICAFSVQRRVRNDSTVSYGGGIIDIPPAAAGSTYAGHWADVRHQLDDQVHVYIAERKVASVSLPTPTTSPAQGDLPALTHQEKPRPRKKRMTFKEIAAKHRAPTATGT